MEIGPDTVSDGVTFIGTGRNSEAVSESIRVSVFGLISEIGIGMMAARVEDSARSQEKLWRNDQEKDVYPAADVFVP
jgi:hypothetical protein